MEPPDPHAGVIVNITKYASNNTLAFGLNNLVPPQLAVGSMSLN